jgi:hypothetical protein
MSREISYTLKQFTANLANAECQYKSVRMGDHMKSFEAFMELESDDWHVACAPRCCFKIDYRWGPIYD